MAYNPRMSMARTTSQHQQRAPAPNEHDAFMTLVCAPAFFEQAQC
jgi:kinetochore protein Nuf2